MASIHKNGSRKNWFCAFYLPDGTRAFKSTGTADKKTALKMCLQFESAARQAKEQRLTMKRARDVIADIYANIHGEELPSDNTGDYFKQWLERKTNELSDASFSEYTNAVNQFIQFIGVARREKSLDTITKTIVSNYRDSLLKRVSPATTMKNIKILRAAFNDAISEGRMRENPASDVKIKEKGQGHKRKPFPVEAIQRLVESADDEWRGMILIGFYTGARMGDIALLTWDDVDLVSREIRFTTQKTDREMGIPISDTLMEYLTSVPSMDTGGPLFPTCCEAYKRARSASLSGQFHKIMVKAGLVEERSHQAREDADKCRRTTSKWSFHCLRHSLVSGLKNAGVGDFLAKEIAGHESDAISKIYSHADSHALRDAVNKLPKIQLHEVK